MRKCLRCKVEMVEDLVHKIEKKVSESHGFND